MNFPHSKEKICKILLRYARRAWKHENAQTLGNKAFHGKIEQNMEVETHDKNTFHLPRQCLRNGGKSLDFIGFLGWKRRIYTLFTPLEDRIGIVEIIDKGVGEKSYAFCI